MQREDSAEDSYDSSSEYSSESDQEMSAAAAASERTPQSTENAAQRVGSLSLSNLRATTSGQMEQQQAMESARRRDQRSTDGSTTSRPAPVSSSIPPRVPSLQLQQRPPSGSTGAAAHKPPKLDLKKASGIMDRSASAEASALPVSIQLVSDALRMDAAALQRGTVQGLSRLDVIKQYCGSQMGLAQQSFRLFELRELPAGEDVPSDCTRLAVCVDNSEFSLTAMERIITENMQLQAQHEKSTSALEGMQQLVREQNQAVATAQLKAAELEAEVKRLHERCRQLDKLNESLSLQLQKSDQLRQQGQQAINDLRKEFNILVTDVSAATPGPSMSAMSCSTAASLPALTLPGQVNRAPDEYVALASALVHNPRLMQTLEMLSQEPTISRLEACVKALQHS